MTDIVTPLPEENPPAPTFVMDQSPHVLKGVDQIQGSDIRQEAPRALEGQTDTALGKSMEQARMFSPSIGKDDTPKPEFTSKNSMGQAIWESAKRDSFIGNSARWLDQTITELSRTNEEEAAIWNAKEELTYGVSPEYHEDILNAPTFGLAQRESERIRSRELAIKREYNQSVGKSLVADIAGFMIDPSNLIPGYGMLKSVQVARKMSAISMLKYAAASTKGQKMKALAVAGAFEEAIRMAPRYASDPTYEAMQYMEGIVMSAAFSGLLPAVGGLGGSAFRKIPDFNANIQMQLHKYGIDVGVRQAARFPGQLKETGFKDPGTALRKSKEQAQDAVNRKVKDVNANKEARKATDAIREDLKGETPSTSKLMEWADSFLDGVGDTAIYRVKIRSRRAAVGAGLSAAATVAGGPVAGLATAALYANKDYLAIGAKLAIKAKRARRVSYNAAITAGDEAGAAKILREAKTRTSVASKIENLNEDILTAVDVAKKKIREINKRAEVCA